MIVNGASRTSITVSDVRSPATELSEYKQEESVSEEDEDGEEEAGLEDRVHHAAYPIPIIGHIVGGSLMMLAAPIQFNSILRNRRRKLHRTSGYLFIIGGVVAGVSAVWMTLAFPDRFMGANIASNLLWGSAMASFAVLALLKAKNKKFAEHRAWVIRTYALAAGPATHRLLFFTYLGPFSENLSHYWDIVLSVMTILVGEVIIRRAPQQKT